MKRICFATLLLFSTLCSGHDVAVKSEIGKAQYIANEGVLVQSGDQRILFDPFFHQNFGIYQSVPDSIKKAIMNGDSPYQNINAIFISHAHGDHFAADDTLKYMMRHRNVELFAPAQAVAQLIAHEDYDKISPRINTIKLEFGDKAAQVSSAGLTVDAVRIPHAGWPGRADVENIVFKVTLESGLTVMHLGDADVNVEHYIPYRDHWRSNTTEIGFPPYWFFYSLEGRDILSYYMQIHEAVGVHVPTKTPEFLDAKGYLYFSTPGQWHPIHTH